MKKFFSVIIPVYNGENTICRCLNSILQSQREDIEVIIVNDVSTDNTKKLCQTFAENDSRIIYIEQENRGVSSARNKGIEIATGEIVCFIDGDDFITANYFDKIYMEMKQGYDFLMFGKRVFDGQKYIDMNIKEYCCREKEQAIKYLSNMLKKQMLNSPWDKVYRLQIIKENKICFPETLHIGEDKVFVVQYIMFISSMKCIKDDLYIASIENRNSLSRKVREDLCDEVLSEHKMMFDNIKKCELSEKDKFKYLSAVYFSLYRSAYTVIGEIDKYNVSVQDKNKKIKEICEKYSKNQFETYCDLKTKIIALPIRFKIVWLIKLVIKVRKYQI